MQCKQNILFIFPMLLVGCNLHRTCQSHIINEEHIECSVIANQFIRKYYDRSNVVYVLREASENSPEVGLYYFDELSSYIPTDNENWKFSHIHGGLYSYLFTPNPKLKIPDGKRR